jgi:hexosaminidase
MCSCMLTEKLSLPSSKKGGKLKKQILLRLVNLTTGFIQFPFIRSLDEAYVMKVERQTICIEGQTKIGVFYGIQSLLSLLEASSDQLSVPLINITDAPRIPYRGLLLDIARNFIGKEDIFKILQVMAMYKMNKLHLHLTDDQGWRLQIPGLPELTQV